MRRSGATLLEIEIVNAQRKSSHGFTYDLKVILGVIRPLSARWRSFITPASSAVFSWDIAVMLKDVPAPNLEVLGIHDYGYGMALRRRRPVQLLEGPTPRLRKLVAPALAIGAARLHISSSLQSIDVERHTFHCETSQAASDIRALLSSCPHLESLRVTDTTILSYEDNKMVHYASIHPSLKHVQLLHLGVDDARLMKTLLATVHLPALLSFSTYINLECLQVICQSSPCPRIQNIRLRAGRQAAELAEAPDVLLPTVFKTLPCLKSLELRDYEFSDDVWLKELGYQCPKLESLDLQLCNGISEMALKKMIEARIKSADMQQLTLLTVSSCGVTETSSKWLGWFLENVERVEPRSFRKRGFQAIN